ncbi:hypothetical protein ABT247_22465 [Kitasatospora sp. NPDC001539]|uniref:hypothetical protein n=1 Tax=Kitasatospora sp. NPDC001539 TaxID=3154384 RepID=UPI003320E992
MADLLRDDHVAWLLDPSDGAYLPDVHIEGTTTADRQSVLDLVVERGWAFEYTTDCCVEPLPRAEAVLSRPPGASSPNLRVRPEPEICAVVRFLAEEQIDSDLDLRELRGQERLDVLCAFLTEIGQRLGTSVPVYFEGDTRSPFLEYDHEVGRVRVLGSPPAG